MLIASGTAFLIQFSAYTYLEPYLSTRAHLSVSAVPLTLLGFGAMGVIGSFVFTRFIDAVPKRSVVTFLLLAGASVATLPLIEHSRFAAIAVVTLWGLFWGALPLALQVLMSRTAGQAAESGQALLVSTLQISLAAGSALGGVGVDALGLGATFLLAGGLAWLGAGVVAVQGRRSHST